MDNPPTLPNCNTLLSSITSTAKQLKAWHLMFLSVFWVGREAELVLNEQRLATDTRAPHACMPPNTGTFNTDGAAGCPAVLQ
jgi:hypothetical protein